MRPDLEVVAAMVPRGSRVLDLGCGDGALLEHLARVRGCDGHGVEISSEGFAACVARGVPVIQADIDGGIDAFADRTFDLVVLSHTIQAVHDPVTVLREIARLGPSSIVSFPNFGHWRARVMLAVEGRMPVTPMIPNPWFSTPNIHLCTLRDFDELARAEGFATVDRVLLGPAGRELDGVAARRPNALAAAVVVRLACPPLADRDGGD